MRAQTRVDGHDRGATVTELVVAVAILTVVMAAVFAGMYSMQGAIAGGEERLQNLDEARHLMAVASRDLRTAVRLGAGESPFVYAAGNEAIFHANLDTDGAPKKVRIHIDDEDRLVEEVWEADEGSSAPLYTYSGAPEVRLVGRYLDNDEAVPLFTYLDTEGNPLGATPLSEGDRLAVKAVQIKLVVKKATNQPLRATTLVNRVRLPNVDYNAVAE